jgi:hypothetical protein
MTKKEILKMTGLKESEFYKKYPTQEHFMAEYGGRITPYAYGGVTGVQSDYPTHQMMYHGKDASNEFNYNPQFKKGGYIQFPQDNTKTNTQIPPLNEKYYSNADYKKAEQLLNKAKKSYNASYLPSPYNIQDALNHITNSNDTTGIGIYKKAMGGEITTADKYAHGGTVDVYQLMGMPTPKMYSFGGVLQNIGASLGSNVFSGFKGATGMDFTGISDKWYADDPSTKGFKQVTSITNPLQEMAGRVGMTVLTAGAGAGASGGAAAAGGAGNLTGLVAKNGGYITPYKDNFYAKNLVNPYSFTKFAYGGEAEAHEASTEPQYIPIEVEKNEQLIRPTFNDKGQLTDSKLIRNYKEYPKHNADGSPNPGGYTNAMEGDVVLSARLRPSTPSPTKKDLRNTALTSPTYPSYSEMYKQADKYGDSLLKKAIVSNQMKRSPVHQAKHGGIIRRYVNGGLTGLGNYNPQTTQTPYASWYGAFGQPLMNLGSGLGDGSSSDNSTYSSPVNPFGLPMMNIGKGLGDGSSAKYEGDPADYKFTVSNGNTGSFLDHTKDINKIAPYATTLGMGLYDAFQKPFSLNSNKYKTDHVKPKYLTGDAGRRDLLNAYSSTKAGINSLAGKVSLYDKYAEGVAKYNENLENQNVGIGNQFVQTNSQIDQSNNQMKFGIDQFNEQNRAAKRNAMRGYVNDLNLIGQNERNSSMQKRWMQAAYPNFKFNW